MTDSDNELFDSDRVVQDVLPPMTVEELLDLPPNAASVAIHQRKNPAGEEYRYHFEIWSGESPAIYSSEYGKTPELARAAAIVTFEREFAAALAPHEHEYRQHYYTGTGKPYLWCAICGRYEKVEGAA